MNGPSSAVRAPSVGTARHGAHRAGGAPRPPSLPRAFWASRWGKIGIALVVFGWGPLLAIIALADLGLWPDPNPNPIGPGLLFFFTSWPAIICLAVGAVEAWVAWLRSRSAAGRIA